MKSTSWQREAKNANRCVNPTNVSKVVVLSVHGPLYFNLQLNPIAGCFTNDGVCELITSSTCSRISLCKEYFNEHTVTEEISKPAEDQFGTLCSPSEIGKNLKVCINNCREYQCCFDAKEQCDKSTLQCDNHSICAELGGQNQNQSYIQYSAVDLAKACNSKQLTEDPEDCRSMCKGSACKFSSSSTEYLS